MIQHEVWRLAASGLLNTYIDSIIAITNRDARARLVQAGAFHANLLLSAYASLSYVPEIESVYGLDVFVVDQVYNPRLDPDMIPIPENATGGAALACDTPAAEYELMVYSWDFTTFTEVGLLTEHSTPGAGVYVLACRRLSDGALGLPTLFLTVE